MHFLNRRRRNQKRDSKTMPPHSFLSKLPLSLKSFSSSSFHFSLPQTTSWNLFNFSSIPVPFRHPRTVVFPLLLSLSQWQRCISTSSWKKSKSLSFSRITSTKNALISNHLPPKPDSTSSDQEPSLKTPHFPKISAKKLVFSLPVTAKAHPSSISRPLKKAHVGNQTMPLLLSSKLLCGLHTQHHLLRGRNPPKTSALGFLHRFWRESRWGRKPRGGEYIEKGLIEWFVFRWRMLWDGIRLMGKLPQLSVLCCKMRRFWRWVCRFLVRGVTGSKNRETNRWIWIWRAVAVGRKSVCNRWSLVERGKGISARARGVVARALSGAGRWIYCPASVRQIARRRRRRRFSWRRYGFCIFYLKTRSSRRE